VALKKENVTHRYHTLAPTGFPVTLDCTKAVSAGSLGLYGSLQEEAHFLLKDGGRRNTEESFYIIDLQAVDDTLQLWHDVLPRVQPFYAVKCNPDAGILETLAAAGANFDCASPNEIERVLGMGVSPSRILYANPCKRMKEIKYALENGVTITTLDSIFEVDKIAQASQAAGRPMSAILRVYAFDPHAQCLLGNKFGAHPREWPAIMARMVEMGVPMAGVSFHVGSGACTPAAFESAVAAARDCIEMARSYGLDPTIIDVGGGFVPASFAKIGAIVGTALDTHFPPESGFTLIAEPGRLFAERCAHLMSPIIGKKIQGGGFQYWISDGLYGSFNCVLYDHAHAPLPIIISERELDSAAPTTPSKITGPTCDSIDSIFENLELPDLSIGDWMLFPNMGAYTLAGASCFNGLPFYKTPSVYVRLS